MRDRALRARIVAVSIGFAAWACSAGWAQQAPSEVAPGPVLILGDSIMAWNEARGTSVADVVAAKLDVTVVSSAVPGARVLAASDAVPDQYRAGTWSWVVVQGGGNDLVEGCGCGACDPQLDRLVAPDGATGAIADLVARIRADGPAVLLWSYYAMPADAPFPFGRCNDELVEMRVRLERLAARHDRVIVLDGRDVVQPERTWLYDRDRVHPSPAGSRAIGERLAAALLDHRPGR